MFTFSKKIPSKLEVAPYALKMLTGWMGEWVIPLRLLQLLEHLAVPINCKKTHNKRGQIGSDYTYLRCTGPAASTAQTAKKQL